MKKRENGLDLLKVIAAFNIVLVHTFASFLSAVTSGIREGTITHGPVAALSAAVRICMAHFGGAVPMFFMASGAFILASAKTADVKSFYHKTWKKLGIPTIIFTLIYMFLTPMYYLVAKGYGEYGYLKIFIYNLRSVVTGVPAEHMWYMFVLITLYLMAPFVVMSRERIGEKAFAKAALVLFIWGTVDMLLIEPKFWWSLGAAIDFLGIYAMGYVLHRRYEGQKNNLKGAAFILLGELLVLCVCLLYYKGYMFGEIPEFLTNVLGKPQPFNPLLTVSAGLFFTGFGLLDIKKDFGTLSGLTYYTYLVHPVFIMVINAVLTKTLGLPESTYGKLGGIGFALAETAVIYVLSMFTAFVINKAGEAKKK
ncbi:MAG: acyltransferase [Lachnospiraceae bacterium]|nr:acyltransferase [Lachnospiraceae bacterium]